MVSNCQTTMLGGRIWRRLELAQSALLAAIDYIAGFCGDARADREYSHLTISEDTSLYILYCRNLSKYYALRYSTH